MPRITEPWGRLLLLGLTFLLIFIRFNEFFHTPNTVIEPYGDGFKAYTVIWYHAKYDSTYSHFEGMNYPYGDHAVPAATQPVVSSAIKFISRRVADISDYTVAIINFSMLLGILLCSIFLYLILRRLDLPVWYSIPVAIGVTFLAPQTHRMIAHYGLAHPEVIPLVFYLLMRFDRRPRVLKSLVIGGVIAFYALIHFYFLALLGFLISFYFLFSFLYRLKWNKLPRYILHYSLQILLPAGLLFWWITTTDRIEGRNEFPWGFFHYRAFPEGVFTSLSQPYFRWVNDHIIKFRNLDFESLSYIGLVAGIVFFIIAGRWAYRRFQVLPLVLHERYDPFLNKLFFTSLAILLFAFGLPFIIPGLQGLLQYTGPIRQFRSIGRFAWIFYFAINIIAFLWVYRFAQRQSRFKPWLLAGALLLLWSEAYRFTRSFSVGLDEVKEFREGESFTRLKIDFDQFQAIHTVPFYNLGSGNFWWDPEGFVLQKSLALSIQTGLPVTSSMLTRTSLDHAIKLIQMALPPYRRPAILSDFPDDRPLLLVWDKQEFEKERDRYEHFLTGTELLYEEERLALYKLPLESFAERIDRRRWEIERELAADTLLHRHGDLLSTSGPVDYVFDPMDSLTSAQPYRGSGGFTGKGGDLNILYQGPLPEMAPDSQYLLQVWMFLGKPLRARSELEIVELRPEGEWLQHLRRPARQSVKIMDDRGWALLELPFQRREAGSHFRVAVQNQDLNRTEALFLDELLLRPKATDLYHRTDTTIWKNDQWFPVRKD